MHISTKDQSSTGTISIWKSIAMDPKIPSFYLLLSLLSFSFVSLCFSIAEDQPAAAPSVYDILQEYGLPRGLLPDSVKSYSLSEDGAFEVKLEKPCYVKFDYLIYYEKKITGKLKPGSIAGLKGIQVQRFFLWFDVDEIKVDLPPSNDIYFTVGIINKKLDVGQFQTIHSCRDNKACTSYGGALRFFVQVPNPAQDAQMLVSE